MFPDWLKPLAHPVRTDYLEGAVVRARQCLEELEIIDKLIVSPRVDLLGLEIVSACSILFRDLRKHLPNKLPKEVGQVREQRIGLVNADEIDFQDWLIIALRNGFKEQYPDGRVKTVFELYTHLDISLHALEIVGMCVEFDTEPHDRDRAAAKKLCIAICGDNL